MPRDSARLPRTRPRPSETVGVLPAIRSSAIRSWFLRTFPGGPTPAQRLAWPAIASGEHVLLVSPTGSGKTLAAFLAILDRLFRELEQGGLEPGLRCVFVSPLRSLGYDIERNLLGPLEEIRRDLGLEASPVTIGVRSGDTSGHLRRKLRERPPHLLITTPESLSLLLSQKTWGRIWQGVEYLIVDEVHALVPTKRGADLAVSLERLSARSARDPSRIGLSATCRPPDPAARFLVGAGREARVIEAPRPDGEPGPAIEVDSLLQRDEEPHRGLTYRRLLRRIRDEADRNRTTIVFANTRAVTERITHDLRERLGSEAVAAHHSALDARRRRAVEARMKAGELRTVVSSTSLELGVDIGTADLAVLVGLPGSVSRCLQRVGRAGHQVGANTRGLMLAATPAELAGAAVTARAAREGRVEPLRMVSRPLDVLCQQLIGMACAGECSADEAFALVTRAAPMAGLSRDEFEACLDFLAGALAAPPGAWEPEPGASPRWTSPRIWKKAGLFGVRNSKIVRWFRANVGTITSEESVRVVVEEEPIGTLEGTYAERLQQGDRFVLDGRALEFLRLDGLTVHARRSGGDPKLPRWTSDRQGLSAELASELAAFRYRAATLLDEGPSAFRSWLVDSYRLEPEAIGVLEALFAAQERLSEVPRPGSVLVEEAPDEQGYSYTFHAPLGRSACEAAGRAVSARLGRRFGRDLRLVVADLGWQIRLPVEARLGADDLAPLLSPEGFSADVLEGVDRGDLLARRFRHVAATALMVLRRPEGGRTKVGGLLWVSQRLFPLVQAACPDHPLLRETRREVLDDLLDATTARAWLESRPVVRFRSLEGPSPFAAAWIDAAGPEPMRFESPEAALRRFHERLFSGDDA
ncbi:DEAD/DEAH box helicase [Tautonia sociabilis]|uniref:DEAD/DEAH box helicase n=1 Tax=Tautonia sociabilis TaxID=2080755 RepID=A0A432MMY5_9BACT|nr:DEAD/DEAH box helicase [Tautonia sociabilis]RUL88782.1 DEAD/DEAH box helicase [Tautonia sociabilis]